MKKIAHIIVPILCIVFAADGLAKGAKNYYRFKWSWGDKSGYLFIWQESFLHSCRETAKKVKNSNLKTVQVKQAIIQTMVRNFGLEAFRKLFYAKEPIHLKCDPYKGVKGKDLTHDKNTIMSFNVDHVFSDDFEPIANENTGNMNLIVQV